MEKIGIICGNGQLPLIASENAKKEGYQVFTCAIKTETDKRIETIADEVEWVKLGELKRLVKFFKKHSVEKILFLGKITKTDIFRGHIKPDLDMLFLFTKLQDKKDDTVLAAICDYLSTKELEVINSTLFLGDCLPGEGLLTKKKPTEAQEKDIHFAWQLAKESARLDIGQTVIVKDMAVLAVEAIEGTDSAIKRGGELGKGNIVVVKVEKPNQDMRFDVPTIGPETINSLIEAKASVLAFEAKKTIFVEKEKVIEKANQYGIVIIGKCLGA